MANLSKLEFVALDISGKNYLSWILDAEIHLDAMGLGNTIKNENILEQPSNQDKAKAMIFLRHHLDEALKAEYLTVKDPTDLWNNLNERYDHQKTVILPRARFDWLHLWLQDFKSVSEYNSAMFKITSQLKLCGETVTDEVMLEKTFSTFHATNILLQQQYREKGFTKYSELISCLLVAEQNNELLLKNHQSRPTGSSPFPEVNATSSNNNDRGSNRGRGRGRGRGRHNYRPNNNNNFKNHQKWENNKNPHPNDKSGHGKKNVENACHRCGMTGHWSRTCRTPKHFVDLYQSSLKSKEKNMETNFVQDDFFKDQSEMTHLDVADFLVYPEGTSGAMDV